jgi:AraC family transcriptional regulator
VAFAETSTLNQPVSGDVLKFGRAFALAYGMPPGEYRRHQGASPPPLPPCPATQAIEENPMYTVAIEERPAVTVAAIRHNGAYHDIGTTFEKLGVWAAGRGIAADAPSYGIYYNDPESKPAVELVSDACVEIPPDLALDGEVRRLTIAGGHHAILVHTGPYAELERPYRWLFGEWLPASGEEAAEAPVVEQYLNDPHSLPPTEWRTAICLPLRKRMAA